MKRRAAQAHQISRQAAGHRDAVMYVHSLIEGGASVADVMVAGGLRGLTTAQTFQEEAA